MDLYEMKLHDSFEEPTSNAKITRVPGGWIYNWAFRNSTMFVPYTDEFNERKHAAQAAAFSQRHTW